MLSILKKTQKGLPKFVTSHLPITFLILEGVSFNVNQAVRERLVISLSVAQPQQAAYLIKLSMLMDCRSGGTMGNVIELTGSIFHPPYLNTFSDAIVVLPAGGRFYRLGGGLREIDVRNRKLV